VQIEPRRYAGAELEKMDPSELIQFAIYWSHELGDGDIDPDICSYNHLSADQEMEKRWGAGASDGLAEYFTASHASYDDMARMAREQADLLVEFARGEHDCGAHQGDFSFRSDSHDSNGAAFKREACRCGRIWGRIAGTYFDPTNTTVAEVLSVANAS